MDNIELAHKRARRGKHYYAEVAMVDADPERFLGEIHRLLVGKAFRNSDYTVLIRKEGPKEREIWRLPYYPDRIIHHCILNVLEPILMRCYIRDTYAALPGRGIHDGVKRVRKALKDVAGTQYCLKLDVRKFYQSVDHGVLKMALRRKIKDPDLLWLMDAIIDSAPGVPIGNYTSQHFANFVLSGFDHWVKEVLGARCYFRYCDDMVLLGSDKAELHEWKRRIEGYLEDVLRLEVKGNWQVFPVAARGIDFLGYRFFHGYTLVRKSIVKPFKRRFRAGNRRSMAAYNGWFKWADTHNLQTKYDWRSQ
jgi:hypothetical protein